ncbi:MAG: GNAT family N-acetyltransferase [Saprospiraceae bacterium]|nr:GNAT family N-acetyltransferase [Saprospiraceae bacterium]
MKWITEQTLETNRVKLIPLHQNHKDDLLEAESDGNLSKLWYTSVPNSSNIDLYIRKALEDYHLDKGLAFVVVDKISNKTVGCTRYTNATPEHRRLEIGYTWYSKTYQRTHVNSECKLLLLTHAFEVLKAIAVEFRTNWYNFPSRNAILRLGAKQDGVLRNHQILPDESFRDTVVFSITADEWRACKNALNDRIEQIHQNMNSKNIKS